MYNKSVTLNTYIEKKIWEKLYVPGITKILYIKKSHVTMYVQDELRNY